MTKTTGEEHDEISYACLSPYDDYDRIKEFLKLDPENKLAQAVLQIAENRGEVAYKKMHDTP